MKLMKLENVKNVKKDTFMMEFYVQHHVQINTLRMIKIEFVKYVLINFLIARNVMKILAQNAKLVHILTT